MSLADYRARRAAAMQESTKDWTEGNTSKLYRETVENVERILKNSGHDLISGRTNAVARTIVSTLAHNHGMVPGVETQTKYETPALDRLERQLDLRDATIEEQQRVIRELTSSLMKQRAELVTEIARWLETEWVEKAIKGGLVNFRRAFGAREGD